MNYTYKEGVPELTDPLMILAAYRVATIYQIHGYHLTITSTTDGKHKTSSLHYKGLAFDIRNRQIPEKQKYIVYHDVKEALKYCSPLFQVIIEQTHIHIEFDSGEKNET